MRAADGLDSDISGAFAELGAPRERGGEPGTSLAFSRQNARSGNRIFVTVPAPGTYVLFRVEEVRKQHASTNRPGMAPAGRSPQAHPRREREQCHVSQRRPEAPHSVGA